MTDTFISSSDDFFRRQRADQNFDLKDALDTISSAVLDQSRGQTVDVHERATKESAELIAAKKSANVLVKNLEKMSRIDLRAMVEEGTREETRDKEAEQMMTTVSDIEPKRALHGEDLIKYKKRGTIHQPRSSIFPLSIALTATETVSIVSRLKQADEKETSISKVSTIGSKVTKSENVGVWSMMIEVPSAPALSYYEATAIACILEECVDQLSVLQYAIPVEINEHWESIVKPISEKYGVADEPQRVFRKEANLPPLTLSPLEKLQRDRTYMHNILIKTLHEVKHTRRFDVLETVVNEIAKMLEDEHNLEENYMIWQNQVQQLQELIKDEKDKKEREKRELMELAQKTNSKVDDTMYEIALKLGYNEKWENARLGQQNLRFQSEEQVLMDEVNEYRKEEKIEEIVNAERALYFQESIKDMEDEMLEWSRRYDEEYERRQREIDDLKARVEQQKLEIQDLRTLKDERQSFIDACQSEIQRLEAEAKYQATINRAATIIQSAWRGYMVRHELGEYGNLRTLLLKRKKLAAKKKKKMAKLAKLKKEKVAKAATKK